MISCEQFTPSPHALTKFWDSIDFKSNPNPFPAIKPFGTEISKALNSNTPFSSQQLDLCWYTYTARTQDIDKGLLSKYLLQTSMAGFNGQQERVCFRSSEGCLLQPVDAGNETSFKSNLFTPTVYTEQDLLGSAKKELGYLVYAGVFHRSFGHFFLEVLPRLWLAKKLLEEAGTDFDIYLNLWAGDDASNLTAKYLKNHTYAAYINALGLEGRVKCPESTVRFTRASIIPPTCSLSQTGLRFSNQSKCAWSEIGASMSKAIGDTGHRRVYFSRSKVKTPFLGRKIVNEEEVEDAFRSFGFLITSIEEIRAVHGMQSEQYRQAIIRDVEIIAGPAGSNILTHVFASQSTQVILLTNDYLISKKRSGAVTHTIYHAAFLGQGANIFYDQSSDSPEWIVDISLLVAFLESIL